VPRYGCSPQAMSCSTSKPVSRPTCLTATWPRAWTDTHLVDRGVRPFAELLEDNVGCGRHAVVGCCWCQWWCCCIPVRWTSWTKWLAGWLAAGCWLLAAGCSRRAACVGADAVTTQWTRCGAGALLRVVYECQSGEVQREAHSPPWESTRTRAPGQRENRTGSRLIQDKNAPIAQIWLGH
jgi:hypothetical protein